MMATERRWPLAHGSVLHCHLPKAMEKIDVTVFEIELANALENKRMYSYALFKGDDERRYHLHVGPFSHNEAETVLNYVFDSMGIREEEKGDSDDFESCLSKDMTLLFYSLSLDDFVKGGKMYDKVQRWSRENGSDWQTVYVK